MRNATGSKCSAATVYCKMGGTHPGNNGLDVGISTEPASRTVKNIDAYICISCGYFESYLLDPDRLEAIARD